MSDGTSSYDPVVNVVCNKGRIPFLRSEGGTVDGTDPDSLHPSHLPYETLLCGHGDSCPESSSGVDTWEFRL